MNDANAAAKGPTTEDSKSPGASEMASGALKMSRKCAAVGCGLWGEAGEPHGTRRLLVRDFSLLLLFLLTKTKA